MQILQITALIVCAEILLFLAIFLLNLKHAKVRYPYCTPTCARTAPSEIQAEVYKERQRQIEQISGHAWKNAGKHWAWMHGFFTGDFMPASAVSLVLWAGLVAFLAT